MADVIDPTLDELLVQQDLLSKQIAQKELPALLEAKVAMGATGVRTLIEKLTAAQARLPASGQSYVQLGNVLTVLTSVPGILDSEEARLNGIING